MAIESTMMRTPLTIGRVLDHGTTMRADSVVTEVHPSGATTSATFGEVGTRCAGIAAALETLGIGRGDVVAMLLDNRGESLELLLSVPAMGAVIHPVNVRIGIPQILAALAAHDATVLVTSDAWLEVLAEHHRRFPAIRHVVLVSEEGDEDVDVEDDAPASWTGVSLHSYEHLLDRRPASRDWPELDENAAAMVTSTSGTTGTPKTVAYSHRALYLNAMGLSAVDGFALSVRDTVASLVPFFHVGGWGIPFATFMVGNGLVITRSRLGEHPPFVGALERALATGLVTAIVSTPVAFTDFVRDPAARRQELEGVDRVILGGSGVSPALMRTVRDELSLRVIQAWGMTETGPVGAVSPGRWSRDATDGEVHSSGRFHAQMAARIVDFRGVALRGAAGIGELEVRGPHVTSGYLGDTTPGPEFEDGWFRTGDIAHLSAEGTLTVVDRAADAILSGGEWISSVDLENAVMELPAVTEAACVGVPDRQWGQRPLCVVVREAPTVPQELWAALADIPEWRRPDHWAFIDALPRTSVGKFDKRTLRRWYSQGRFEVVTIER